MCESRPPELGPHSSVVIYTGKDSRQEQLGATAGTMRRKTRVLTKAQMKIRGKNGRDGGG